MVVINELSTASFGSDEFIDAIAVQPCTQNGSDDAEPPLVAVAFSALESNQWGGGVILCNGATGERVGGSRVKTGVSGLAWVGETCDLLALGCDNGDVQVMQLLSGNENDSFKLQLFPPTSASSSAETTRPGHDDVVTGIAASQMETNIFASCSWDRTVKVWDVTATDKTLTTLDGHSDLIWDIAPSKSQAHLWATASQDATVQLWDDRQLTQAAASTLSTLAFTALAVDWHPSEPQLLAVGLENGSVLIFDTRAPQAPLHTLAVHDGAIHCVKYSPFQADTLGVGSDDACVSIISNSATSCPTVHAVAATSGGAAAAHRDYVRALDWSAPTVLATGSWDHTLRSWTITNP